jgi:hypothetical protein
VQVFLSFVHFDMLARDSVEENDIKEEKRRDERKENKKGGGVTGCSLIFNNLYFFT